MIKVALVTCLLFLASVCLSAQEAADALWSKGLFLASTAEIIAAAKNSSFPGENDVVILYKQGRFRFTESGSLEQTTQLVYQILSEDGLKGWGGAQVSWSPWHQDRPEIHVRVINGDGKEWYLDPNAMVEGKSGGENDSLYSDSKTLEAPYPQVHIGSIIEEQVQSVSRPLLEGGGFIQEWRFFSRTPTLVNRLIIEAPASLAVRQKSLGHDVPPVQASSSGGAARWEYFRSRQFPADKTEDGLPRDVPPGPSVCFSTAPSWDVLAAAYSRLVDQKISAQNVDIPGESVVKGDPVKTSINLMRWINTRVRYVGLELGSNSIEPYTPREILARGYGDCKDKATLLVSFLRQAGYKACVALLWNDSDEDIVPDMPGMDVFDHAIVYVDGPQPLWLDPTSDFSRDEKLPYWDQERWALPARPETTGLVRTPVYPAASQDTTQTNDYFLQDSGNCNVTETTAYGGGLDLYERSSHAFGDPAEIKKDLESYVERYYSQKKLESFTYSDAHDLDTPFTLTLHVNDTPIGQTYAEYAEVAIKTDELFDWLPSGLLDKTAAPRTQDYRMNLPFIMRLENRIHPPSGFIPRGLPDPVQKDLGAVTYQSSAQRLPDGTIAVHMSIETRKGRLSPSEFDATRKAVIDYEDSLGTVKIVLDHEAEQLYAAGDYLEAFKKFRELTAREPSKAIHEIRLSKALLKSGLGDEAVSAARRAVDLAPSDGDAWSNIAWILQHDMIGRRFGQGYDRDAALAAYRKSMELAPGSWSARADYAILLEHDKNGIRYAGKGDLALAVEQYALIKDSLKDHNLELNPVIDLWFLGRFADMENMAGSLADLDDRETCLLAARSAEGGTAAGVKAMNAQLSREKRQEYQARAARMLATIRRYTEASELFRLAARGSANAVDLDYQADLMASTRLFDPASADPKDPTSLANSYYRELAATDGSDFSRMKPLLAAPLFEALLQKEQGLDLKTEWESLARVVRSQNSSMESLVDIILSHCAYDIKGTDNTGYHVVMRSTLGQGSALNTFFMLREDGRLKIAALFGTPSSVPAALRGLCARQDWGSAAAWLDWIRSDVEGAGNTNLDGLKDFWPGSGGRGPADIQPAVDFLSALFARQRGDLEPAWKHLNEVTGAARTDLLTAIIGGSRATLDWAGMLSAAGELMQTNPDNTESFSMYIDALYKTHNWDRMELVLNDRLKGTAPHEYAVNMLLSLSIARRDSDRIQSILQNPGLHLSAYDYNSLAWLALFQPALSDQALEYARRAVTMSNSQDRAILHTMATLYAQSSRYEDARKLMDKCLELSGDAAPRNEDWYVFGRIAEGYGFIQSARNAYAKVEKPDNGEPNSTWELAQRRLSALGN